MDVNEFKSKLTGAGARPNLFRVILNFPGFVDGDTELASFMCKGAAHPPSNLGEIPIPYRGRQVFVPGDRTYEPWEVTILNDTGFEIRDALNRWSNGINSAASNVAEVDQTQWYADLAVEQLGKDGEVLKSYKIVGAFPTSVGQIDLNYDSTDAIEEFTCTFRYLYWE